MSGRGCEDLKLCNPQDICNSQDIWFGCEELILVKCEDLILAFGWET